MGGGVRLGRINGFEITLDYSWFVIFVVFAWTLSRGIFPVIYGFDPLSAWLIGVPASLLLFGSVLVHELAHAVAARRHGVEVTRITLFLFGGAAQLKDEPGSPRAEFQIAVAGPIASFFLGVGCLILSWIEPVTWFRYPASLLNYLGVVNIILAIFNLIPGMPLDGGRILRSIIWRFTGNLQTGARWAAASGQLLGGILIAYGLVFQMLLNGDWGGLWPAFVGWFIGDAAGASYRQSQVRGALAGVPVSDVITFDLKGVDADLRIRDFVEEYLLKYEHEAYPVSREGDFIGIITLQDVRKLDQDLWGVTSVGALTRVPEHERIVWGTEDAWDAFRRMAESGAGRVLVMSEGRLEGTVSQASISRVLRAKQVQGAAG